MEEAIEVTLQVTRVLERLAVAYAVGGSIASSLHGTPRSTQDADVVADLRQEHVAAFVAELAGTFYVDEPAVRDAVGRRSSFNVIHLETLFKVDVFVAGERASTRSELERRQAYTLEIDPPREIIVASPEDVIVQKLYWYRLGDHVSDRQWQDARSVLTVRGNRLDLQYMRWIAEELGVADLLERMLAEGGPNR